MKTNVLGNSDLAITPVGFGAWAIGGDWEFGWGAQDDEQSIAAIHRALELGVNWIDTAAVYGLGHSEEVVARALQEWQGPSDAMWKPRSFRGAPERRRDCLFADGLRTAHRRDDTRTPCLAAQNRLAHAERTIQGTKALRKPQASRPTAGRRRPTWPYAGRNRYCLGVAPSGGNRRDCRRAQFKAGGRDHRCSRFPPHAVGNR